jgi:DNA-binding HxlR family transcriptional regulator
MSKRIYKNSTAHLPEDCRPSGEILAQLGDKWTVSVLGNLSRGRSRFSELESQIGNISQRMLTLTLRSLERDGLVARHVTPTVPPRVDYELTERGQGLMTPLVLLHGWAVQNIDGIDESRRLFDAMEAESA